MTLPRNLLPFCIKSWKREFKLESYCKAKYFHITNKSHITKRHIDVIRNFWNKHKASASAENVYITTANIQASGKDDSIKEHQKAESRIEINEQHPKLIQDLQLAITGQELEFIRKCWFAGGNNEHFNKCNVI